MPRPKQRLYFDYAASTPVAPEVEAVMRPYFLTKFGNAGSLHSFGQEAITALDEAKEAAANAIGAEFREIIFTGSATEANNLAIRGTVKKFRKDFPKIKNPEIIVSAIEHESVLETARDLPPFGRSPAGGEKEGAKIIYLPVSKNGIVNLKKLKESLNERTVLVSVMYANNEIGTIQPIAEISKIIKNFREESRIKNQERSTIHDSRFMIPFFHTDAVQAFQFLDCDVNRLGVDLMTLSGHKIYGPKGVGALYVRRNQESRIMNKELKNKSIIHNSCFILPIITGGGQEFGLRSGTENIPSIVGFAKAISLSTALRAKEAKRIAVLRDYFWKKIKNIYPKAERNGDAAKVLPNFLNIYFPGRETQDLLTGFDLGGLAVSAGSACSARSAERSYVIKALGLKREQTGADIRITLGRTTSKKDIDTALKIIKNVTKG